jgi:truncated hemoglobin YjbI
MKAAHKGRGIKGKHFDGVAKAVVDSLKELGVSDDQIAKVVAKIAPLKADCIEE